MQELLSPETKYVPFSQRKASHKHIFTRALNEMRLLSIYEKVVCLGDPKDGQIAYIVEQDGAIHNNTPGYMVDFVSDLNCKDIESALVSLDGYNEVRSVVVDPENSFFRSMLGVNNKEHKVTFFVAK